MYPVLEVLFSLYILFPNTDQEQELQGTVPLQFHIVQAHWCERINHEKKKEKSLENITQVVCIGGKEQA